MAQIDAKTRQESRAILQQLIEINTTDSVGNVTTAAEAMAKRLRDAGFAESDIFIGGPNDRKKNMVARLHGTGPKKPILLIGHLDVVEAHREDWTRDPFKLEETDGFFYGRGTQDMKASDAILVLTMIRFKQEGYKPDRDIILALTADEEGGKSNGVDWLLKNHRELIDAEFVLNPDGGGVETEKGKPVIVSMDASEKLYADFELEVTNAGGHSSLPIPDNAIYHLCRRDSATAEFSLSLRTQRCDARFLSSKLPRCKRDRPLLTCWPSPRRLLIRRPSTVCRRTRTTTPPCTQRAWRRASRPDTQTTRLPQRATANVNCRILPGHSREEVRKTLVDVIADPKVSVTYVTNGMKVIANDPGNKSLPPVPLKPEVMVPLEKISTQMWSGAPVVPTMATGASDGVYTNAAGMATYGVCGLAIDIDDQRAHGRDERLGVESYYTGVDFYYRYLKAVTAAR